MGAALHLAHAHQPAPGPRRKRKRGGGGGDGYDALVTRVYQDQRMTPEARELILLLAWLTARDPNRYDSYGNLIGWRKRASVILGEYGPGPRRASRLADLLYADRPRYEDQRDGWEQRTCAAPMIRREGLCGQHATDHDYTVDQTTGWRTAVWYCRRHEPWGQALRARRLADPGPDPNTRSNTMNHPADEIHQAANKLRGGMGTIHPDIALPLAEIMGNFADSEYDREATVQETDARHERMLHLARVINGSRKKTTSLEINTRPATDDAYARGFAAGRRAR